MSGFVLDCSATVAWCFGNGYPLARRDQRLADAAGRLGVALIPC